MAMRVGVIGLGLMGSVHVAGFKQNKDYEVVAVCDVDQARAHEIGKQHEVPRIYADPDALLRLEELDVLGIATPPDLHHSLSIAGLQRGWHVLCEKPTAMNSQLAEDMWRQAAASGCINIIDHELRFNGNRSRIKELLASGFVGTPRHVLVHQVSNGLADVNRTRWTWWSQKEHGGGLLGETGSHAIDLLRWWFGDVLSARGAIHTFITVRPDRAGQERRVETDDYASFSLRFNNDILADVILSGVGGYAGQRTLEIHGEEGALVLDDHEQLWGYRRDRPEPEDLTIKETIPSLVNYPNDIWSPAFVRLIARMAEAIQKREKPVPASDFYDGLQCQRVMDAI